MMPPSNTQTYAFIITIQKEYYHKLEMTYPIYSTVNTEEAMAVLILTSTSLALTVVLLPLSVFLVRRKYMSWRTQKTLELLELRKRFDDVKNIIGVLVMMRGAGLPVYSRLVRGEFEETATSGFISAISSFREEIQEGEKLWETIPISDIISAVQTKSLICALITFSAPTENLKRRLENFATNVGFLHDNELEAPTGFVTDPEIVQSIDELFTTNFEPALVEIYVGIKDEFVETLHRAMQTAISALEKEGSFIPEQLIQRMVLNGVNELEAYSLVIEVIEKQLLKRPESEGPVGFDSVQPRETELSFDEEPPDLEISLDAAKKYSKWELEAAQELLRLIDQEKSSEKVENELKEQDEDYIEETQEDSESVTD
jgi:hypothetical protein